MWRSKVEEWGEQYGLKRERIFFLVSGPSGTGKTVLIRRVLTETEGLKKLVSTTARERRSNEKHGDDYYFVSKQEFENMIQKGQLVEWKLTLGDYYGLTRSELSRYPDHDIIFDMDVRGKKDFLQAISLDTVAIFLMPPSLETLRQRLLSRNDLTTESVEERLLRAKDEIASASGYDFVVENTELDKAVEQIKAIITAERSNRDMRLFEKIYPKVVENLKSELER